MAKIKGPKKTNRSPDEFKIKTIQLADHPDILAKDVAEDLGIHPILLYRWRKEYSEGKFKEDKRKKKLKIETRKGQYAISINKQWRVCFEWRDGNAYNVQIIDYH